MRVGERADDAATKGIVIVCYEDATHEIAPYPNN
jgi:hypothetical protein